MYFYTRDQLLEKSQTFDETQAFGGYVYNPRNELFYWASEGKPTRMQMIDALVEDFKKDFPVNTKAEICALRRNLSALDDDSLQLLVSQV